MYVDQFIYHIDQLVTCAAPGGPKRLAAMQDPGLIEDGAIAVHQGQIVAVGPTAELRPRYSGESELDASGHAITPGFVDPHTHVVYAGDRVAEFEMRIRGATYMEIMQAGGGIASSMRQTRLASLDELVEQSQRRLKTMLQLGTTTAEVKSGYGLDTPTEIKMLQAIETLDARQPLELVPTFLGAHAVPPEYKGQTQAYVDLVVNEMLPAVAEWYAGSRFARQERACYCDVFCEAGVFDLAQARQVLEAGLRHGLRPKIHADEFENLGGVSLAIELGAVSADHLDATPPQEIERLAHSDTLGVSLPVVNFNLGSTAFAPLRQMIDAGAAMALSTDINPGSAPCPSMPVVMSIACRYQRLLPVEALNASTINAAYAIGLGECLGSLEAGKQADLLLLATHDYRHIMYQIGGNLVQRVMKRGVWVV